MRNFDYFEPTTLDEAVALLRSNQGSASVLAGGTDLLVQMKEHLRHPAQVINIKKIAAMHGLEYAAPDGLRIGALVTTRAVETSAVARRHYAGLCRASTDFASVQVRNRATVVGNVCRASPSADTLPPLIADAAVLGIHGPDGARTVALEDFFTGAGKTVLGFDEIATHVTVPAPPPHTGKVYIKHGRRIAMELATVGVAVTLTLEGGVCSAVRIVLGAVAATPLRARRAETLLLGQRVDAALVAAAAAQAMAAARPISDVRASADYRRQMVGVLTRRALEQALQQARENTQ
ncbi:aerobic carbon-monoxide dehydrogenase medium subunit [Janthinobacterium sp. CG_23.3]|uniref:FAD binding domain-containing protein n=1 Tax=unclassified Janthinobacterium TaxID=2610881 RepID=UPI000344B796|nr:MULTISPECIES: xanthine dehydrogenase family protein subunit M [unclassified Janthinobacterium]MEC5160711.1 carbon-monoxide dehydrogenase medium subunit [Janthinobacterium sp. CG_S6]